jgi:hypothetical protein
MFENYEKFLEKFDGHLKKLFENQKENIYCKRGCSLCCKQGDYPFSQLEFSYLTKGYLNLSSKLRAIVQNKIQKLLKEKAEFKGERFEHECPFLIGDECCVYKYRGIICRTFGLCYYDEEKDYVRLPGCVDYGLNYSKVYNKDDKTLRLDNVPVVNLRIDKVLTNKEAQILGIESGEIRPMLDWLKGQG